MASHRRATMTDGEIDGVVQLPLLSPLHIQHTPVNLVALCDIQFTNKPI
jgi:hypothetical protein